MAEIPDTAPKPQDHQKKKSAAARKAEADGFVIIEQCGVELKIPVGDKLPLDAFLVLSGDVETLQELGIKDEDKEIAGTRMVLGAEQWAAFRKASPTLADFNEIGVKLQEATGN